MQITKIVSALLLAAFATAAGAQAQGMSLPKNMQMRRPAPASAAPELPLVDGEVTRLDKQKGLIVLKHGEIPNLATTSTRLGFEVLDRKMLDAVKVGDKVKFQAEIVSGKATLTELMRVR
jgi:Cu/Ag efflux protein CusF